MRHIRLFHREDTPAPAPRTVTTKPVVKKKPVKRTAPPKKVKNDE